jgi:hypothetical protein
MVGDPHPRSAHRAGPAGGLALLTPQALVRQAQAGQARARQAIIRQAIARQRQSRQAQTPTRSGQARARRAATRETPAQHGWNERAAMPDGPARHGWDRQAAQDGPGRRAVGEQTTGRLTAIWQAAALQAAELLTRDHRTPDHPHPDRHAPDRRALDHPNAGRASRDPAALDRPALDRTTSDRVTPFRVTPGRIAPCREPGAQHRVPRAGHRTAGSARQLHASQLWAPREPQQVLQTVMRGLAALIVMAIVGLSGFFIVAEERRGHGRESAAPPGSAPQIASREVDGEPLTQREVFPEPTVPVGAAGYEVTMTHSDSECRIATIGELGALLEDHGCDQVIRARLTDPHGGYQVTAGIFNLADEGGAGQVSELTGTLVENGRGTFATLGGSAGDPLAEPLAQVNWHSRGHYLLYCVIARPDGQLVTDDDPYAARITTEIVEQYLGEQVVGQRTLDP